MNTSKLQISNALTVQIELIGHSLEYNCETTKYMARKIKDKIFRRKSKLKINNTCL